MTAAPFMYVFDFYDVIDNEVITPLGIINMFLIYKEDP